MDTAAEVQLAVIGDRVAEQRCIAVEGVGHQQLDLAGLGVYLDQDAAAVSAVLVAIIEGAVEHGLQAGFHNVLIELVAQDILHQGQRVAHSRVAGTHIHPVTVSNSGPAVVLAAVARVVVRVAGVGDHIYRTVANIIHDAVCRHGALGGVGDLFKRIVACRVRYFLRPLGKRRQGSGCKQCRAQGQRCNALCNSIQVHAWLPHL